MKCTIFPASFIFPAELVHEILFLVKLLSRQRPELLAIVEIVPEIALLLYEEVRVLLELQELHSLFICEIDLQRLLQHLIKVLTKKIEVVWQIRLAAVWHRGEVLIAVFHLYEYRPLIDDGRLYIIVLAP